MTAPITGAAPPDDAYIPDPVAVRHVPFEVTARLGSPVAVSVPWGIALDGLLAAEIRERVKAAARDAGTDYIPYDPDPDVVPPVVELPLARCTAAGDQAWHWCATFAHPVDEIAGPHVEYWTTRPDQRALADIAGELPVNVSPRQGRYRAHIMPLPVTIAAALCWRGVGDPDQVHELLSGLTAIGRKRSSGYGHILGWTVTAHPDAETWEYSHLHRSGKLGRTTPPACLTRCPDVAAGEPVSMGLRPPYMHPSTRGPVHAPI
jgi:CRISPR type IV-associated protein Csf3